MEHENDATKIESIEQQFEDFMKKAREVYPNIAKDVEVYASYKTDLQSYEDYLSLINQAPNSITTNRAYIA